MATGFDARDYPLASEMPHWLTDMPFWQRHIPFAFALTEMLRPGVFVELGTHMGDSYCAFCQAVAALDLPTACYAVDTWAGDQHTGHYETSIFERLRAYHDPRYGRFSTLVRSLFDDAVDQFADGSIDLLHIDGTHTYEAVKHDFETWLPKLSEQGVVILHDVMEYRDDFGVWRLWEELCARYPHFAFPYGHGLGVVAVGHTVPAAMQPFLLDTHHTADTLRYFYDLSERIVAMRSPAAMQAEVANEREWTASLIHSLDARGEPAPPRLIAFYLPQFHPIPENDVWWGKGFTEWTNVVQARPLFTGHYQPHLPADLGFYDLRLPEVRQAQAHLARQHGIHGFCYYHYWFKGRRLLERPFDEVLASGQPDFPFCLFWANENWTRTWDAGEQERLVVQEYSDEDDLNHIRWLINAFNDERYIRIDGRPLLLIYRTQSLPNAAKTFALWREECRRAGIEEPYIVKVESEQDYNDPQEVGCDASADFVPHDITRLVDPISGSGTSYGDNLVLEYRDLARNYLARDMPPYTRFPCVVPAWDNTPRHRSGKAAIIKGSTPELYEHWLRGTIATSYANPPEERIIFINAWNEWAEGAHLEPDVMYGHAYLEATRRALHVPASAPETDTGEHAVCHLSTPEDRYQRLYEKYRELQGQFTAQYAASERTELVQKLKRQLRKKEASLAQRVSSERERRELQSAVARLDGERRRLERMVAQMDGERRRLAYAVARLENQLRRAHRVSSERAERLAHLENELIPWKNGYIGELESRVRNLEGSKVLRAIHRVQRRFKSSS